MAKNTTTSATKSIIVVGGGIAGLTTAIEAAEVGYKVFIIEQNPYLGGRVAQLNKYFPKLCPPTCGLEINFKRIKDNPNIKILTLSRITKIDGSPGDYNVSIKINPRYVNENCTCCGDCYKVCKSEISDEYNLGMQTTKGVNLPFEMAFPSRYVISPEIIGTDDAINIKKACKYNAVDLKMEEKTINLSTASIVWATGWSPYDANKIDNLGFGKHENIITNMMLERLASKNGPTKGKILRPSDGVSPKKIAFVQCAGSRDENHLPYCSYVCCMASLKQTTYIRDQYPDSKIYIFYIDIRTPGDRYEKFYKQIKKDKNVFFIKGKVAEIKEDPKTKNITVIAEDTLTGKKIKKNVQLVVLATGMQPNYGKDILFSDIKCNEDGFIINDLENGGIFAAGCANKPTDVISSNQNATGMALKAIQCLVNK